MIYGVQLSGVKTWAQTAVEGLKEECENQLVTETEPELPPVFCLNDCSGNGKPWSLQLLFVIKLYNIACAVKVIKASLERCLAFTGLG